MWSPEVSAWRWYWGYPEVLLQDWKHYFFIFWNSNTNYPIVGCPDNIPGVSYRTQRSAWMDDSTFRKFLREPRAITSLPNNVERILLLDNCSDHNEWNEVTAALVDIDTSPHKLPHNIRKTLNPKIGLRSKSLKLFGEMNGTVKKTKDRRRTI